MIKTIGHSNHPIGRFVDLLKSGGVEAVVDVRSTPYSRRFPQFGRERLAQTLSAAGILYRYEGAALGGKPKDGASYDALAGRPDFKDALERLIVGSADTTLCLMCAEKEPLDCHRCLLVGRALCEHGLTLGHIRPDGSIEAHAATEERLLALAGGEADLFRGRADRLAHAYRCRARAVAARLKNERQR